MALMDDRYFLIQHIRNSFITSDDTGMSELIIEGDEPIGENHDYRPNMRPTTWHGQGSATNDELERDSELSHSPDIIPDMDFGSHRRRSNTAQKLEKLKKERQKQTQMKHIQWKDSDISASEMREHFEKKDPSSVRSSYSSALSQQIEASGDMPINPFMEYACFDGLHATPEIPAKTIGIFLTMCEGDAYNDPMFVSTLVTSKIQELIGLVCFQYVNERRQPSLIPDPDAYALYIADDDGAVDYDFPAIDRKEPVIKFGFRKLAMVEIQAVKRQIVVTINMPNRGFTKIPLKDDKILVKDLLDEVLKRRRLKGQGATRLQYRLEKQDQPGVVIDLEQKIGDLDTHDYCLVRENSVRGDIERDQEGLDESDIATSLSSHQYKSYEVTMTAKLGRSMDVQLGISGEKIEIDPHGKARFLKQKAVTHDTECLAACNLLDDKISTKLGKSTFRLVYHTGLEFRHHDFECETAQASEIVQKVNNIMDMRSSPIRKEYKVYKGQKKMQNPFKKRSSLSS